MWWCLSNSGHRLRRQRQASRLRPLRCQCEAPPRSMMVHSLGSLSRLLCGLAAIAAWVLPAHARDLPPDIAYSAQVICLDEAGNPTNALPIDESCVRSRLQRSDDVATYRKHDWPNSLSDPQLVLRYQASNSVVERLASRTIVVKTFNFGTAHRSFSPFVPPRPHHVQLPSFFGHS